MAQENILRLIIVIDQTINPHWSFAVTNREAPCSRNETPKMGRLHWADGGQGRVLAVAMDGVSLTRSNIYVRPGWGTAILPLGRLAVAKVGVSELVTRNVKASANTGIDNPRQCPL
jgi:hypothetical protein